MAVGNVMRELADGPAIGTVGGVELLVREAFDSGAELGRGLFDFVYDTFSF
jgi:hypothetical protein